VSKKAKLENKIFTTRSTSLKFRLRASLDPAQRKIIKHPHRMLPVFRENQKGLTFINFNYLSCLFCRRYNFHRVKAAEIIHGFKSDEFRPGQGGWIEFRTRDRIKSIVFKPGFLRLVISSQVGYYWIIFTLDFIRQIVKIIFARRLAGFKDKVSAVIINCQWPDIIYKFPASGFNYQNFLFFRIGIRPAPGKMDKNRT